MSDDEIKLMHLGVSANSSSPGAIDSDILQNLLHLDNDVVLGKAGPVTKLDMLPVDIWMELFEILDIKTLTVLRRVCKSFRSMINDVPSYRLIYNQVPSLLRVSIITGVASFFSISDLHRAYRSTRCGIRKCCNDGEFVYLLGLYRICHTHVEKIKLFGMESTMEMSFKESALHIRNLPRMNFSLERSLAPKSCIFLDENQVKAAQRRRDLPAWLYAKRVEFPAPNHSLRLGASLRIPWFDPATRRPSWGFFCAAENRRRLGLPAETLQPFLSTVCISSRPTNSILEHFEDCKAARQRWKKYALVDKDRGEKW